jgi:iron complex outermembrane receptor protein
MDGGRHTNCSYLRGYDRRRKSQAMPSLKILRLSGLLVLIPLGVATAQDGNAPIVLEAVNVEGVASPDTAWGPVGGYVPKTTETGAKTDTPILKIPQSIDVISADQIRAQGATTVSEALRYSAGVAVEQYGSSSQFDTYTLLRGFKADFFLDGLRLPDGTASSDWASSVVEPYGLERIEVLKGPSSVLYGQSGPGGIVNMVSKRPTEDKLREVEVQTGSFGRLQGAFDLSGPLDPEGQFLYRLTGLGRLSETQVDFMEDNRLFIAPALTWNPSEDTSLTFLGRHLMERGAKTGFNYLPTDGTLESVPGYGRLPYSRYSGEPGFDRLDRDQSSVGYVLDHRFNDAFSFHQNARYTHNDLYLRALNRNGELVIDPDPAVAPSLNRRAFRIDSGASAMTIDNRVEAAFDTAALSHKVIVGADYRNDESQYDTGAGPAAPIEIFDPDYGARIRDPGISFQKKDARLSQFGVYVQDQITYGGWVATLAGRYDWSSIDTDIVTVASGTIAKSSTKDRAFSGRAGLSYVFESGIAPYVSYSTSFQPTAETGEDGTPFDPLLGRQIEAGVKYQPPGMDALFTAAIFDIEQTNTPTADRTNLLFREQLGEVRVRGFEAEVRGQMTREIGLIASYAYLDHKVTRSTVAADIGNRLASTPVHQASLWAEYGFHDGILEGLSLGTGIRYVGSSYNGMNTVQVPSYALVDMGLTYDFGAIGNRIDGAQLQVNATNLFDKYYVTQCGNVPGCTLGSGRTITAALRFQF